MIRSVDGERLLRELDAMLSTWRTQSADPANEKPEWTRGVVYGITLAMRYVSFFVSR